MWRDLCQILDIGYEFGFVPLSSSKRDAESDGASSEFDRPYLSTYSGDAVWLNSLNCWELVKLFCL